MNFLHFFVAFIVFLAASAQDEDLFKADDIHEDASVVRPRSRRRSRIPSYAVDTGESLNGKNGRKSKRLRKNGNEDDFSEGDLDHLLVKKSVKDFSAMVGKWEILLDRSEPTDALMAALGISFLKRALVRKAITSVEIRQLEASEEGRPFIYLASYLPMNNVKEGPVYVDGAPFSVVDSDTGLWRSTAMIADDGRLLQKRVSPKGVMYDVRATFEHDPEGKVKNSPLHLFKWTFIANSGEKYVAHRWFKKLETESTHVE
eukprot:GHVN01056905.1.p1 GENE.GHVN01056905.1~~GHVN01056905.1.p1  ORF type:complete len:259 (+),score=33.26 GHVN01056905.1:51-827(+)